MNKHPVILFKIVLLGAIVCFQLLFLNYKLYSQNECTTITIKGTLLDKSTGKRVFLSSDNHLLPSSEKMKPLRKGYIPVDSSSYSTEIAIKHNNKHITIKFQFPIEGYIEYKGKFKVKANQKCEQEIDIYLTPDSAVLDEQIEEIEKSINSASIEDARTIYIKLDDIKKALKEVMEEKLEEMILKEVKKQVESYEKKQENDTKKWQTQYEKKIKTLEERMDSILLSDQNSENEIALAKEAAYVFIDEDDVQEKGQHYIINSIHFGTKKLKRCDFLEVICSFQYIEDRVKREDIIKNLRLKIKRRGPHDYLAINGFTHVSFRKHEIKKGKVVARFEFPENLKNLDDEITFLTEIRYGENTLLYPGKIKLN